MKILIRDSMQSGVTALAAVLLAVSASRLPAAADQAVAPSNGVKPVDPEVTGVETAVLTQAPNVPPPIPRKKTRQGHRERRSQRSHEAPGRWRRVCVLDVRR